MFVYLLILCKEFLLIFCLEGGVGLGLLVLKDFLVAEKAYNEQKIWALPLFVADVLTRN